MSTIREVVDPEQMERVHDAIKRANARNHAPTVDEVTDLVGMEKREVLRCIYRLVMTGRVQKGTRGSAGLRITGCATALSSRDVMRAWTISEERIDANVERVAQKAAQYSNSVTHRPENNPTSGCRIG